MGDNNHNVPLFNLSKEYFFRVCKDSNISESIISQFENTINEFSIRSMNEDITGLMNQFEDFSKLNNLEFDRDLFLKMCKDILIKEDDERNFKYSKDFYAFVDKELDKRIEGENDARKVIFFVANMRNIANLTRGTDNLMVNDESGCGKDHIVSSIFKLLPLSERECKNRITPKTLVYLNNKNISENGWIKKALYLEDVTNTTLNDDSFKVFSSADTNGITHTTTIINNKPHNIDIIGKPSIVLTIAEANPKLENLRRYPILNLNSSVKQTQAILIKQAIFAEQGISEDYNPSIIKAITSLKRIKVKVPFSQKIASIFPADNVIARTHFPRFLDYIKSSCAFYQFQRMRDKEGFYLAEKQDYEIARKMILHTTSNVLMIPQTKIQKEILERFSKKERESFLVTRLIEDFQDICRERWLRVNLDMLSEKGFLHKGSIKAENSIKEITTYKLVDINRLELPSFEELNNPTNKNINTKQTYNIFNTINTNNANKEKNASLSNLHDLHNMYVNLTPIKSTNLKEEKDKSYNNIDNDILFDVLKDIPSDSNKEGYDLNLFLDKYGEEMITILKREGRIAEYRSGKLWRTR